MTEGIAILEAVNTLISLAKTLIAKSKERGEYTPEQEAEAEAKLAQVTAAAHWQKH